MISVKNKTKDWETHISLRMTLIWKHNHEKYNEEYLIACVS